MLWAMWLKLPSLQSTVSYVDRGNLRAGLDGSSKLRLAGHCAQAGQGDLVLLAVGLSYWMPLPGW